MILAILMLLAAVTRPVAAQFGPPGYVVIVNEANGSSGIDAEELGRMFLKKTQKWQSGLDVVPVDLPATSPSRKAFTSDVLGRSVSAVQAFWQQQVFSGRAVPPAEKSSEDQVVAFVRATPGAVGYVSTATALAAGVKRLQVVTQ